jgi:ADP-ribosylglycohydrolase
VPELITGEWEEGQFTDDTQMTLSVAEWLMLEAELERQGIAAAIL